MSRPACVVYATDDPTKQPMVEAAFKELKPFGLAKLGNLRLVDNSATGTDLDIIKNLHKYYALGHGCKNPICIFIDSWVKEKYIQQYYKMLYFLEGFEAGWKFAQTK